MFLGMIIEYVKKIINRIGIKVLDCIYVNNLNIY